MMEKKENRRQFVIVRPLPPPELNPNARKTRDRKTGKIRYVNWRDIARIRREYRQSTAYDTLATTGGYRHCFDRATCKLVFYFTGKRRRDYRNFEAAMKGAYDGLVDAGLIRDDNKDVLRHDQSEMIVGADNPRVEMIVTEGWE